MQVRTYMATPPTQQPIPLVLLRPSKPSRSNSKPCDEGDACLQCVSYPGPW